VDIFVAYLLLVYDDASTSQRQLDKCVIQKVAVFFPDLDADGIYFAIRHPYPEMVIAASVQHALPFELGGHGILVDHQPVNAGAREYERCLVKLEDKVSVHLQFLTAFEAHSKFKLDFFLQRWISRIGACRCAEPDRHLKMTFTSNVLYPRVAIIDPRMTLTLPPQLSAATGMDALTHAVEAYISLQKNLMRDSYAVKAIEIIASRLPSVVKNVNGSQGRLELANASTMAGIAFSNAMVGVAHNLGHAVGGFCRAASAGFRIAWP